MKIHSYNAEHAVPEKLEGVVYLREVSELPDIRKIEPYRRSRFHTYDPDRGYWQPKISQGLED